ncbi:MAG: transposase, partial [Bacteroidota bacterium]|nr:transposase [Bacteroidota bacterium]
SGKQIQRVSEHYGQRMEEQIQQQATGEMSVPVLPLKTKEEAVYVLLDGSMVLTRKGWKETKVGRLFKASSNVPIQAHRKEIMQSLYVCHIGGHKTFLEKLEAYSEPYPHKVFIADGARWIWNWVQDCYPEAVQILDVYHVLEKLGVYAMLQYGEENQRKQWIEEQKGRLLKGKAAELISELKDVKPAGQQARKAKKEVVRYYESNLGRMQYHRYLEKGYAIGSGAIEAAHRNVVQQRLKLSGQRWNKEGAQQILNLRACKKSNQWNTIEQLIKKAA